MRWSFRTNGNFIDFVHTDETSLAVESTIVSLHNTSKCIDWSLPADTTRISFTIDEVKYSNIPIVDIDFDGTAMDSQDDFETGIEAMFPGLAGGGSELGYKTYVGLFSQSGTNNPTVTVLQNTLGGTVVWTRVGVGEYSGTLSGAFTAGKTWIYPFDDVGSEIAIPLQVLAGLVTAKFTMGTDSINRVYLLCTDADQNVVEFSSLIVRPMSLPEIRVYP